MSKIKRALDARDSHIWTLRAIIGVLILVLFYTVSGWKAMPDRIRVDIPPDLRSGSTRGINERHPFNIYAFSYYIFQQLNHWPQNGDEDYLHNIRSLSCYFTPRFRDFLMRDYETRRRNSELTRSRTFQEMVDRPYNDKRVYIESKVSWVTFFDVHVRENLGTEVVKDAFIRYPIRVVSWDANPECNLWGLALDGFYKKPKRLEEGGSEQL